MADMACKTTGKVEHYVVSNVKAMVPESVRQKGTEYWMWLKGVETKQTGDDDITDKLEMVGWGVEEAQERNNEDASMFHMPTSCASAPT